MEILSFGMDTKRAVSTDLPDKSDTEDFEHCHGHKKAVSTNCQKKAKPKVRKAFTRSPNLVSKKNIFLKKCFESEPISAHVACSFHKSAEIFCPQFEKFPLKNRN